MHYRSPFLIGGLLATKICALCFIVVIANPHISPRVSPLLDFSSGYCAAYITGAILSIINGWLYGRTVHDVWTAVKTPRPKAFYLVACIGTVAAALWIYVFYLLCLKYVNPPYAVTLGLFLGSLAWGELGSRFLSRCLNPDG